jgi:hypothetical protein
MTADRPVLNNHNFSRLRAFILSHSVSQVWLEARLEWMLDAVEDMGSEMTACPCGYEPIRYLCWLLNLKNHARVFVGNVCVNRFLPEHESNNVFEGLKRIQIDPDKAANHALLVWARKAHVITDWEYHFGLSTCRKRYLSERQAQKRRQINHLIHTRLVNSRNVHVRRHAEGSV